MDVIKVLFSSTSTCSYKSVENNNAIPVLYRPQIYSMHLQVTVVPGVYFTSTSATAVTGCAEMSSRKTKLKQNDFLLTLISLYILFFKSLNTLVKHFG